MDGFIILLLVVVMVTIKVMISEGKNVKNVQKYLKEKIVSST